MTSSARVFSRSWLFAPGWLALGIGACTGATDNATECSKNVAALAGLCPAGTSPKLSTAAHGNCGGSGKYRPAEESVEAEGQCVSDGSCEIACVPTGTICPCGVASFGHDTVECRTDCAPGCGDGTCADDESTQSCPGDCTAPSDGQGGSGAGGSGNSSGGSGASGGSGGDKPAGSGGSAGSDSMASAAGNDSGGAGGEATGTGGTVNSGQCATPKSFGRYLIRDDGAVLLVAIDPSGKATQTPVLDARTGKPLANVVDVADDNGVGCAALDDGTVACWRNLADGNTYGALGDGTTDTNGALLKATPVLTGPDTPLEGVVDLAEGSSDGPRASCAITEAGKLYCWGALDYLVNGGKALPSGYAQPITLDGLEEMTGVKQAGIAYGGACAVRSVDDANEVWCWGAGRYAQLPDTKDSQYPVKILGLTNPTKVVADGTTVYNYVPIHTFCALDEGNVRCWGSNAHGEVGDGSGASTVQAPTLVQTSSGAELGGVTDLVGGGSAGITQGNGSFCGLRKGALWCWGWYGKTAANYGVTNVTLLGDARGPTYVTSDDLLHVGSAVVTPHCGKL